MSRLDDPERLHALKLSGLLERPTQQRLEHLAFSACRLLLADACLINALDGEVQRTVIGYPPGEWPDMPLEVTGCRQVVLSGRALIVKDAVEHPVTCQLPWAPTYRGYLGVPIWYDGQVIGSICVLSQEPREWRAYETTALEGVGRLAAMSLEGLAN